MRSCQNLWETGCYPRCPHRRIIHQLQLCLLVLYGCLAFSIAAKKKNMQEDKNVLHSSEIEHRVFNQRRSSFPELSKPARAALILWRLLQQQCKNLFIIFFSCSFWRLKGKVLLMGRFGWWKIKARALSLALWTVSLLLCFAQLHKTPSTNNAI